MATSGATKLTGAPGTRGLSAISLHKNNDEHSALGIWGSNYFRSSTVDLCFLGRPWEDLGTHDQTAHSFGFMALSLKSLWESPKEWELPPTATCLSVPPKYSKVPLNNCIPTSFIFTREEVTWESSCPPTNAELMLLSEPAPCLSHQSPEPFDKLPIPDSICPFIFWLSSYKF